MNGARVEGLGEGEKGSNTRQAHYHPCFFRIVAVRVILVTSLIFAWNIIQRECLFALPPTYCAKPQCTSAVANYYFGVLPLRKSQAKDVLTSYARKVAL
jgi:hypothetical protein